MEGYWDQQLALNEMWFKSSLTSCYIYTVSVADPGFSPRGAPTPKIAIIFQIFTENCMKIKEFGPPGGRASLAPPLDPPMGLVSTYTWSLSYHEIKENHCYWSAHCEIALMHERYTAKVTFEVNSQYCKLVVHSKRHFHDTINKFYLLTKHHDLTLLLHGHGSC